MKKYIKKVTASTDNRRKHRPVMAGESYGWVVEPDEAYEAYEFACEYFGKEDLDSQIVDCLSSDELSDNLAYIFRMNDFEEWYNRNGVEASTKITAAEQPLQKWRAYWQYDWNGEKFDVYDGKGDLAIVEARDYEEAWDTFVDVLWDWSSGARVYDPETGTDREMTYEDFIEDTERTLYVVEADDEEE